MVSVTGTHASVKEVEKVEVAPVAGTIHLDLELDHLERVHMWVVAEHCQLSKLLVHC